MEQPIPLIPTDQDLESIEKETGELWLDFGKLLALFYKEYCAKVDIIPAHEVHNINVFKANSELYRIPLICIRLGDILKNSEKRNVWAAMLISYWNSWRKQNFSSYEAMKKTLAIFTLKWDNNNTFPEIELNQEMIKEDGLIFDEANSDDEKYEIIDEENEDDE